MVTPTQLRARTLQDRARQIQPSQTYQTPEAQQQDIKLAEEKEKQELAKQQEEELDKEIRKMEELARQNPSEEQRFISDVFIDKLKSAKKYATGDYTTESLVDYATTEAESRITRSEKKRELRKVEAKAPKKVISSQPVVQVTAPTKTELELGYSLPANLRGQTATEVTTRQSLPSDIRSSSAKEIESRQSIPTKIVSPEKKITDLTLVPETKVKVYDSLLQRGTTQINLLTGEKELTREIVVPKTTVGDFFSVPVKAGKVFEKAVGKTTGAVTGSVLTLAGKEEGIVSPMYYGEKIGRLIDDPSIAMDFFRKTKPDVVYDITGGVVREPTKADLTRQPRIEVLPESDILSKSEIVTGAEFVGQAGASVGKYFIPVVGTTIFASEVESELRPYDYNPLALAKEKPVQAVVTGGAIVGFSLFKGIKKYKEPLVLKEGEDILLTTKGRNLFGKRVRVSTEEGLKFELLPARPKFRIQRKEVTSGQLKESVKQVEPTVLSLSDEPTYKLYENYLTPIKDTKGYAQTIQSGEKRFVTEYLRSGKEKTIFTGLSPFTKEGKIERALTLEKFKDIGVKGESAKGLIKLRQPKILESKSDITGLVTESELGQKLLLRERETTTKKVEEFTDVFSRVKSRGGKPVEKIKDIEVVPVKIMDDTQFFRGEVLERTTTKPLGKQEKRFDIVTGIKKTGEKELPVKAVKVGDLDVAQIETFDIYRTATYGKDITLPKFRRTSELGDTSVGNVIVRKPTGKDLIDLDEQLGATGVNVIEKSGVKSSEKYLKQLYGKQDITAGGLGIVKEIKVPKAPKPTTPKIELVESNFPTYVGGTRVSSKIRIASRDILQNDQQPMFTGRISSDQLLISGSTPEPSLMTTSFQTEVTQEKLDLSGFTKQKTELLPKQRERQEVGVRALDILKLRPKQEQQPKEATKQTERLIDRLRQRQQELFGTPQKTRLYSEEFTLEPPKTPKVPVFKLPSAKITKRTAREQVSELFTALGKVKGEDIVLGEFKTKPQAERELKVFLKTTLGASGKIKKGERELSFGELESFKGLEFRPAKRDVTRVVQERGFRLGTRTEVFKIQQAKRGKKQRWL